MCVFNQRTCLRLPLKRHKFLILLVKQYCNCNCIEHQIETLQDPVSDSNPDLGHLSNHPSNPISIKFTHSPIHIKLELYFVFVSTICIFVKVSVSVFVSENGTHSYFIRSFPEINIIAPKTLTNSVTF